MFRRIHFLPRTCGAVLLGLFCAGSPARAARPTHPVSPDALLGTWSTEDGHGVIAIEPCGDALCGRIVGIARPPGAPVPRDVHGASQCGLIIISDERPTADGSWLGHVTDPRTGITYGAEIWLDAMGNLRLRGFLGVPLLGQTQTWHRFTGHLTASCEPA
jgi:uncharacterized protein (DUF2147 family)